MSHDLRLREEVGSTKTPSEKGGCAGVERSPLHSDVHHGSNSAFAESGLWGGLAFLACSSDTWRRCTVARPQVASLRFNFISVRFVAGLRRSLRLQYVKKSVNNPSSFAGECTPAPPSYLVSQVRSGSTAASAVGSAAGSTSGAAPGFAAGSAAGSSERISILRRNSGFENFSNRWGTAELSRRQESIEN